MVQVGSVLLVKYDGVIASRNLTPVELSKLERDPLILRDPAAAMSLLRDLQNAAVADASQPAPEVSES
ncbi:hypothetical protein [Microbispora sp. ATCC PTA-5024]|uniref:hypothetical protein n=1 Tax=Microbispora sp. ATCC PTA-5024 TaxID=316330 RepID=UPI0003DD0EF5|nr:hypothetical protein [Microbispora sp. ATCC PTA-5024]ETK32671.1 hypothetical protein MPTA5024_28590 [Microbispora sp. ATCC PTA-5024]